jgi:hypothetical protein
MPDENKTEVWSEMGEPLYPHTCHGGGCYFIGCRKDDDGTIFDIYGCNTGHGTALLARWSARECDVEVMNEPSLTAWAIDRLEFAQWTIDQRVRLLNGGEPC